MVKIKAVVIKGSFTEADWEQLCRTLRTIERRHPDDLYQAVILDPDTQPVRDGAELIRRTFPKLAEGDDAGVIPLDELLDRMF